jgi:hypothetical protein
MKATTLAVGMVCGMMTFLRAEERKNLDVDFEALFASDIFQTQTTGSFTSVSGRNSWRVSVSGATIGMDFESVGSESRELDERRLSGQLDFKLGVGPRVQLLGSMSYYDGFGNYSSLWLSEYYRQLHGNPNIVIDPSYADPKPQGASLTGGARVEYLPAAGYLETTVTYASDVIAPGYGDYFDADNNFQLVRLRDELNSVAWGVRAENILTRRLRSLMEFRLVSQSLRELRYVAQGQLNWAVAEPWVVRLEAGYANEKYAPDQITGEMTPGTFEAKWGALTAEYHPWDAWYFSLTGRYYSDNGQTESSISASSAAPALQSWSVGLGVRWVQGRHSIKVFGAPYMTRFEEVRGATVLFGSLYRDRHLGVAQASYSYEF